MRASGRRQIGAVLVAIVLCMTGARAHAQECGDHDWMQRYFLGFVPAARSGHAMCYDTHRNHTVLFGGKLADGTLSNGTWIYDGVAWRQLQLTVSPSAREQHAMVYDSQRDRIYLFGGLNAAGLTNHTYEFNPETNTWTQLFPATNPTARMGHAMCYDSVRGRTVLMGGEVAGNALSAATWEFDPGSNTWSQFAGTGPTARAGHAMCFDASRGVAVLFGGRTNAESVSPGTFSNAVWEFNGTVWDARTAIAQFPSPRSGHTMVFDTEQSKSVIIGGRGDANADGVFEYSNATWTYDGAAMVQTMPTVAPTVRAEHGAAYDEVRKRTVLVGGLLANNTRSGATLEFGQIEQTHVTLQPESLTLDAGANAIFTVLDDGHLTTYQWFKGDAQLWDFGLITGAATRQLAVNSVTEDDEGAYWCRITNVCGETDSQAAILTVSPPPLPPCVLDVNGDHRVDALDAETILEAMGQTPGSVGWVAAADLDGDQQITQADLQILSEHLMQHGPSYCEGFECPADFNVNGQVTADDIFAFLDAWFAQNGQTGSTLTADIDDNDAVTADDIFAFLDAWFVANGVGCD